MMMMMMMAGVVLIVMIYFVEDIPVLPLKPLVHNERP